MEEVAMSPQDNIWCPSFLSLTSPLTFEDFVMKNDMTVAVVVKNLLTPKDNRLLSKRSDELAVKDSLALSKFVSLFERHLLPSSSGSVLHTKAPNDRPPVPLLSRILSSTEAPNDQPPVPYFFGVLPSPKAPNDHLLMPPISGVPSYFGTRS
ncbi:hypothetical protein ACFX2G_035067 [Malus domestica]